MKKITSFTIMQTAEGKSVVYTYTILDEDGNKLVDNERKTFILLDENISNAVNTIEEFLINRE